MRRHTLVAESGLQNTRRTLDPSERREGDRITFGMTGGRPLLLVSESGLYKLIMRSDKATSRPFQDWVTIRKAGLANKP
ncbi:MAG: hypothetical protein HC834_06800 [Rhodospirillales bacterium]|nr:hypothetical protein [Rhodospirillales bacterium]